MNVISLNFSDKNISVSFKKEKKNVNIKEVIDAILSKSVLRTGLMAPGVKDYVKKGGWEYITLEIPPRIRKIGYKDYDEVSSYIVPFPPIIFILILQNRKLKDSWCYAVKKPLAENTCLYLFPYGNVDGDGHICWGRERSVFRQKVGLSNVNMIAFKFFSGNFNDDYSFINKYGYGVFEKLNGKKKFPLGILRSGSLKYRNMIKEIIGREN